MPKTVNILGETPKQQWMNAIMIFEECIKGNVRIVREELRDCDISGEFDAIVGSTGSYIENLDIAMRNTENFADEMRRLVEGVFDDD